MLLSTLFTVFQAKIGSFLGFGDHLKLMLEIQKPMIRRMRVPDPEVQVWRRFFNA